MHPCRLIRAFLAACIAVATTSTARVDAAPVRQVIVPFTLKSGPLFNRSAADSVVYSEVVNGGDVPWIRLSFGRVQLAPGSRLLIESLQDAAKQTLDARALGQWQYTSAYFNGSTVRLSLIAAAGSDQNSVEIEQLIVGEWSAGTESQCGPTDDRVPSTEPARARLLDAGCTASIYSVKSCFLTAGHCLSVPSLANVVEFNVPPSLPGGKLQHPGPEDQYAIANHRQFVDGGVGNDWGLFEVFPNSETGLMPYEAQGARMTLRSALPPLNTTLRVVGYGVDAGQQTRSQTQQEDSGPLVGITGTALDYRVDTESGNSGSAVTVASDDTVVGVHAQSGCDIGGGFNQGTAITLSSLQTALGTFCPEDTGVSCDEISSMVARCNQTTGVLQVIVRMTDTSNEGQTVVVTVDGSPLNVPIDFGGGRFGVARADFGSGNHTVRLVDPAGCPDIPTRHVSCP